MIGTRGGAANVERHGDLVCPFQDHDGRTFTQRVLSPADVANAVDNITSSPAGVAVMLLFFVLGFGGLLATLYSLWRSRAVPRVAVLILLMGFAIDIAGRATEGHLITFVGAT
jgi:hypothetical protein